MNLLTIALLLVIACNLGILWLYIRLSRQIKHNFMYLDTHMGEDAEDIQAAIEDDGHTTRERIGELKQRFPDDHDLKRYWEWVRKHNHHGGR